MAFALVLAGCARPPPVSPGETPKVAHAREGTSAEASSFRVDRTALRSGKIAPKQLAKIDASAFRYSRMLARPFELRTCEAFADLRWRLPVVAVHGDAHVEQFVVTSDSYGIEDFDRAGYGPTVVDLVRYAASLDLACREADCHCDSKRAVARFFDAYRAALDAPPVRARPPALVERVRRRAPQGRAAWLAWVDAQMMPLSPADEAHARAAWTTFTDLQAAVRPDRPARFFDIVRAGELQMGVGSALERKMLLRVRGPSADPDDDVVLEARAGQPPGASGCVWRPEHGGALHVLMFFALLGPRMPDVLGYVGLNESADATPFWVQSWHPGYVELALADLHSQQELEEVAEDAAKQLAGHFWTRFPEPLRVYQRYAQLQAFDLVRERAISLADELAREVVVEWQRFRAGP
jgi:hypothetical protein